MMKLAQLLLEAEKQDVDYVEFMGNHLEDLRKELPLKSSIVIFQAFRDGDGWDMYAFENMEDAKERKSLQGVI